MCLNDPINALYYIFEIFGKFGVVVSREVYAICINIVWANVWNDFLYLCNDNFSYYFEIFRRFRSMLVSIVVS